MTAGCEGEAAIQTYEIRLLAANGSVAMIHLTACNSIEEASHRARAIGGITYDRYEIWRGTHKVAERHTP
ncbi:MAG: hypothetical protein JSR55_13440 [Proteobacteria bacterium]|nr:hypothetical protein [Pseudomonadota bacterium]